MFLLVVSLVTLALGPLLYRVADRIRGALLMLDGFVMIAIAGLVVVHIVPHNLVVGGPLVPIMALLGFLGPGLIESRLHRAARSTHTATLVLACVGLVLHAMLDGVALGSPEALHALGGDQHGGHGHEHDAQNASSASILALAVVIHRLPVAVTIWWLLRPSNGALIAVGTLIALALATLGGFALSDGLAAALDASWLAHFQALVAGSLLHVVVHRPAPMTRPSPDSGSDVFAGIGAILGLVLVAVLADTHMPMQRSLGETGFVDTFITLSLESAPALLLAFGLAGLVQVFLPQASFRWMQTGRPWSDASRGVVFGLPLPICSCGVVPLYRSLINRGVPATAAMAFLVATPELGLDAILISWPLLGSELAIARVVACIIVALLVGVVVGSLAEAARAAPLDHTPPPAQARVSRLKRIRQGLHFGFGEIVDHIGPWLLLGMIIASLVEPMISGDWITALPWALDVVLFAFLGMPMYVCASGATPLVAVLIHKGVSPGAALAFLLAGPATNITTFGILAKLHNRRVAFFFAAAIAGLAIALGIGLNLVLGEVSGIALHNLAAEDPSILSMACLAGLTVVFALSLIRQGPRGFLAQVLKPHDDDHGHDHGHGHGHDHGHDHDEKPGHCHDHGCC